MLSLQSPNHHSTINPKHSTISSLYHLLLLLCPFDSTISTHLLLYDYYYTHYTIIIHIYYYYTTV